MYYMLAANFIGLPAITVPIGLVPSTHDKATTTTATTAASVAPPAASPGDVGTGSGDNGGGTVLPVGLQLMAPCWHEASLLHMGVVLEAAVAAAGLSLPLPAVWYNILGDSKSAIGDSNTGGGVVTYHGGDGAATSNGGTVEGKAE